MSVDQVTPAVPARPATAARRAVPPTWLLAALGAAYVVAVGVLLFAPGGTFIERLRALDGGICAQLPGHSFYPAGQQLPLCARNTGIYLGFSSMLLLLTFSGRLRASQLPPVPVMLALGGAVALMGVDGFNSFFLDLRLPHLYHPDNLLRLTTGLGTGVAMAALVVPVTNGLVWRDDDPQRSFGSFAQLGVALPILLLVFLGVASQWGILLYPIAILSTAGLILALSSVNIVFMLGVTNRIGRYAGWRQFFPLFTLAIALAIVELMALFLLKSYVLSVLGA